MNRLDRTFQSLKKRKKKAFVAFITAGDPSLKTTEDLVVHFADAGVDVVELGIPFSDPLADGPTIQAASQRALKKGVTLEAILKTVARIRKRSDIPICLMTYYNPVFHYGEERFVAKAKAAGVDGLIIPDLPHEEAGNLKKAARGKQVRTIFFIAPTTTPERARKIAQASDGFIYYVSLTGVTGARTRLPGDVAAHIRRLKRMTTKPICVGFGISTPEQVRTTAKTADGVIVGSAIIKQIERNLGRTNLTKTVTAYVRRLADGLK